MTCSLNRWSALLALAALLGSAGPATAQVIFVDNFTDAGTVDSNVWRLPFDSEGTFVGRTAYRGDPAVDLPQQGIVATTGTDDRVAEINLDTFSPLDPGNQFLGTDLLTKRNFAPGGGLAVEGRLRLKPTGTGPGGSTPALPNGLVNGLFTFDVQPRPMANLVRDEIDFELLSNQANGANDIGTNVFDDIGFTGAASAGDFELDAVAGLDLTEFQTYRYEWTPPSAASPTGRIEWFVNGVSVRTETAGVPDDPQQLHVNLWAPDSGFSQAFDAALQPTGDQALNEVYTSQVDYVQVERFNTDVSANLLSNAGFEDGGAIGTLPVGATTTTGQWLTFANAFPATEVNAQTPGQENFNIPDDLPEGTEGVVLFGPFSGGVDASGIVQQVAASPGEQFEATITAITDSDDSIIGNDNFVEVALEFVDATGTVIDGAFTDPFLAVNGFSTPLIDGRDPNAVADEFVTNSVSAVAPANTAFVRMNVFFIQDGFGPGSVVIDDASLVRLTPLASSVPGDTNGDGDVDLGDLDTLATNFGQTPPLVGGASIGDFDGDGDVDLADLDTLATNFGFGTSTAVPEPSTAALLALGCGLVVRRRR